ncbi:MAG: T9SS type A sorting domain-containing protein [candidate division Zixibacteria bacterium]|nr:T9SS type A sorting domain-containing protein [candidate division Zixibacteria bacterium]
MGKIVIITLLYTALASGVLAQGFYDINTVNTVELVFAESNWDQILDNYYNAGNDERLLGTAIINGEQFDSVGVKYKGNSSYDPSRTKNPFNIKLDHVIDNQLLDGYGTLKLANGFKDPSFVRESLGYEIARKYTPAGLANYINVYVNGELIGLYTNVQSVDKSFLDYHYFGDDNAFFKGDPPGGGPGGGGSTLRYLGPDSTAYYSSYEIRSDSGWLYLVNLCDTLNNYTSDVKNILNVDRALWHMAYHNALVSLDSPINAPHNFYIYRDGTARFNYIFWDLNMTFGTFNRIGGPHSPPLSVPELQQFDPLHNIDNPDFPIVSRLLQNPDYQKIYIAHMKTILEENFTNNWYLDRALEIQEIIDADVQADPNKFFSYADFGNNLYNSTGGEVGIVELMAARTTYLNSHPDFQAQAPVISDIISYPENVPPNSAVWIMARVDFAESVALGFRNSITDRFDRVEMFDDGSHNDGSADDGVYGIDLQVGLTGLQYYIIAINDEAAKLSPERAEYEYYVLNVTGDLVINEFLASNNTIQPDQDGEYDDWIELYNNSDEDIPLNGYYLSDDSSDLTKWAFPDTSIGSYGYLIIWADNDEEQEGLHAGFKLSASGESVLLVNRDIDIIDEYVFGLQAPDTSMGRYPNGTGSFSTMIPSFSSENEYLTTVDDDSNAMPSIFSLSQNYPNPFNPVTTIEYQLSSATDVKIEIFDILGRKIETLVDQNQSAGNYCLIWDADAKPSGVYFYTLKAGNHSVTRKMLLLR